MAVPGLHHAGYRAAQEGLGTAPGLGYANAKAMTPVFGFWNGAGRDILLPPPISSEFL